MNENSQLPTQVSNDWLTQASAALRTAGIPSPQLDAELILAHTIRKNRTYLHAHPDHIMSDREIEIADARLALRLERVPVAYIIGHKEFYGRQFNVTHATLIPRPDSEILIELTRRVLPGIIRQTDGIVRIVDVGTGSGALGITAKREFPDTDVTLIDTSKHALGVAEKNAEALQVDVRLLQGDLLSTYPFEPHVIIANLPYVDPSWERSPETRHEPAVALFAGNNGLALIYRLIIQAKSQLAPRGALILEADPRQHAAITARAEQYGFLTETTDGFGMLLRSTRT